MQYIIDIPFARVFLTDDLCRVTQYQGVFRHVHVHIRIRRNQHVVAYMNISYDDGAGTYPHMVPNGGIPFQPPAVGLADGDVMGDVAIFSYPGFYVYDDGAVVADEETFPYAGSHGDLESEFIGIPPAQPGKKEAFRGIAASLGSLAEYVHIAEPGLTKSFYQPFGTG